MHLKSKCMHLKSTCMHLKNCCNKKNTQFFFNGGGGVNDACEGWKTGEGMSDVPPWGPCGGFIYLNNLLGSLNSRWGGDSPRSTKISWSYPSQI